MTLREYNLLMKARALRRVDEEYIAHLTAYMTQSAKATTGGGSHPYPKFKTFRSFFNYRKERKRVEEALAPKEIDPRFQGIHINHDD